MSWTADAIEIAERLGETVSLALGYQQLGEIYASQAEFDRCDASFARSLELLAAADLPERRAEALERYRRVRDDQVERRPSG